MKMRLTAEQATEEDDDHAQHELALETTLSRVRPAMVEERGQTMRNTSWR